jgi:ABC-type microcin C transport system permease subunit YejE
MSMGKYLLQAMLEYSFQIKLTPTKVQKIANKFKIGLDASTDALFHQVNSLCNDNQFLYHMQNIQQQQLKRTPAPRPLPMPAMQQDNNPEKSLDYYYKLKQGLDSNFITPTPYGNR